MRWHPLAGVALVACTGGMHDPSTIELQQGACFALEGRTFLSVNLLEGGLGAGGPELRHWSLTFSAYLPNTETHPGASEVHWSFSDAGTTGHAECRDQIITSTILGTSSTASFDPNTQTITWAGEAYAASP